MYRNILAIGVGTPPKSDRKEARHCSDLSPWIFREGRSEAYKVGELLTYNGYLYRVTTAIAQNGTITPNTNCKQTTVGDEIANDTLFFNDKAVTATTGDILVINDDRITADHVLTECVWGNSSYITTDVTWTTAAGSLTLNGTCTTATTATVTLVKKCN